MDPWWEEDITVVSISRESQILPWECISHRILQVFMIKAKYNFFKICQMEGEVILWIQPYKHLALPTSSAKYLPCFFLLYISCFFYNGESQDMPLSVLAWDVDHTNTSMVFVCECSCTHASVVTLVFLGCLGSVRPQVFSTLCHNMGCLSSLEFFNPVLIVEIHHSLFPQFWDYRHMLPHPPLKKMSLQGGSRA